MLVLMLTFVFSAAWAQSITVQLRDSDGNAVPNPGTATLDYWNAGWVTLATNDGSGNFVVPTSMLPANVKMNYNFSSEQRALTGLEVSPVVFNTVSFTAVVKDANDVLITGPLGYWSHNQNTASPNTDAGVFQEILPGVHNIQMEFHTSEQTHPGVVVSLANDPQTEVFNTVTITPRLLNCLGNVIDVANDPDWEFKHGHTGPCPFCDLNTGIQLLPGSEQAFWVLYKGVEVQRIGNYPPIPNDPNAYFVPNVASNVDFTASGYVVQLRDSEGNNVPNPNSARLLYKNGGIWTEIATNDGNGDFYMDASLLPVEVMMEYNASKEKRMLTTLTCTEVFTTVTFTAVVHNANGDLLTTPTVGYYNHRQTYWRGSLDAGTLEEILPGTHVVHMVFNTSKMQHTGVQVSLANDPHTEVFTTVAITPKLVDGLGNTVDVSLYPYWGVSYGYVGPYANGILNVPMELLPGSEMGWMLKNGGSIVQRVGNYPYTDVINTPYFVPNVPSDVVFTVATPKTNLADMNANVLYPNPASNGMSYSYSLDQDSPIHMSIYNTTGAQVMLIEDGMRTSGTNVSEWDVSSLAPGMYIFRALLGDKVITERFVKTQ
jgi:hypothetical protein